MKHLNKISFGKATAKDFVVKTSFTGESTFKDIVSTYIPFAKQETVEITKALILSMMAKRDFSSEKEYELYVCKTLFNFCKKHIKYKLDTEGLEEIRLPNRTWADRATGVDCEDFVIFLSGILHNLQINHSVRMVDFGDGWQHIYIIVGKVVLDPVQDTFNYESPYKRKKEYYFKVNQNSGLGKVLVNAKLTENELLFLSELKAKNYYRKEGLNKWQVDKIAKQYGIIDTIQVKELVELYLVNVCRENALTEKDTLERFKVITEIYDNQPILSQRTSNSILLQQYSTPAPIAFLCGEYIKEGKKEFKGSLFEPTAGNGMMTINFKPEQCYVNELDELRYRNLTTQGFSVVANRNAKELKNIRGKYQGVITNPPFEPLPKDEYETFDGYTIKHLDHLLAIYALGAMKDTGRAAIIIGGHTEYEKNGVLLNGKNRVFLSYLYSHYNVEDVINVNGDLYYKQGTKFDIRLILINGRKSEIGGYAPLREEAKAEEVNTFDELYSRIFSLFENKRVITKSVKDLERTKIALKYKYKALAQKQELELLSLS